MLLAMPQYLFDLEITKAIMMLGKVTSTTHYVRMNIMETRDVLSRTIGSNGKRAPCLDSALLRYEPRDCQDLVLAGTCGGCRLSRQRHAYLRRPCCVSLYCYHGLILDGPAVEREKKQKKKRRLTLFFSWSLPNCVTPMG